MNQNSRVSLLLITAIASLLIGAGMLLADDPPAYGPITGTSEKYKRCYPLDEQCKTENLTTCYTVGVADNCGCSGQWTPSGYMIYNIRILGACRHEPGPLIYECLHGNPVECAITRCYERVVIDNGVAKCDAGQRTCYQLIVWGANRCLPEA